MDTDECQQCGAPVLLDAKYCEQCGARLHAEAEPQTQSVPSYASAPTYRVQDSVYCWKTSVHLKMRQPISLNRDN